MKEREFGVRPVLQFCDAEFITNAENKKSAVEIASTSGGTVKKFRVNILTFDPETGNVKEWEKKNGFSVWIQLEGKGGHNFLGVKINNKSLN